jgi:O-antigen/teichoic acid export membrane protein
LRQALPLGAVLMLVSLNTNIPRYAIEHHLGLRELGAFAAVVSFVTAGSTVVNALGQAATPRLARHFSIGDAAGFLRLAGKLGASVIGLGAAGVAAAFLLGPWVLTIAYRPEYADYSGLLVWVMGAAIPIYLAGVLGYAVTATRAFDAQAPLFAVVAAVCGIASWLLVPRLGLGGAAVALAATASLQVGGQLTILTRSLRRPV